jgi:ATP-binding cassette subfamily B protein
MLLVLMVLASIAEVISIGAVIPFLTVLANPADLLRNEKVGNVLDYLSVHNSSELVGVLTVAFVISIAFAGMIRLILNWFQITLSNTIGADLSIDIFQRTLYQPYLNHVSRNSSEIISTITLKTDAVIAYAIMPILTITSSSLMLAAVLIALLAINPFIALTLFFGFSIVYISIARIAKLRLTQASALISAKQPEVIKILQEALGGIRDIIIDGTQEIYIAAYRKGEIPLRKALANVQFLSHGPRFIIEALGAILIAVIAYILNMRSEGLASSIAVLGALALGAQRMLPVLQQGYSAITLMRGGRISVQDALELLEQPMPVHELNYLTPDVTFNNEIRFENLSFRYPTSGQNVLSDLNFSIFKGSKVGIFGKTGCGKSTLLDITMGLILPTDGLMFVDGCVVNEANMSAWRKKISHVPQFIYLADASILENIAFGVNKNSIDMDNVEESVKNAGLEELILSLDEKYETVIGERGVRLSGGQRQRIGIARALYKKANLIVLDEATSALDADTENFVMNSMGKLDKEISILIVAHRISTLKQCDIIFEISEGRISRSGSYEQLFEAV